MFIGSVRDVGSRGLRFLCLLFVMVAASGCATRALMSSDRYEKPEPETQQFRSNEDLSQLWQPEMIQVESAFKETMAE
ncbi:hypothetical protein [Methylophaga sp.]|uniref:hypothetical protein n=1 Tax=Methylophaga sp. TaxID=2024840 RepID=UPI003F695E65